MPSTWHVLGVGGIGQLVAHHLRKCGASVVLLLRSEESVKSFRDAGEALTVQRMASIAIGNASQTSELKTEVSTGYSAAAIEKWEDGINGHLSSQHGSKIQNLLVTVKAHQTVKALRQLRGRIGRSTNIVLLQNGMGVPEALQSSCLFAKHGEAEASPQHAGPQLEPALILGVAKHGCKRDPDSAFTVHHTTEPGAGQLLFGLLMEPEGNDTGGGKSAEAALMDLAKMTASLGAQVVSPSELKAAQREKLLINACINPLTAILDCHNGALLHDPWAAAIMEDVCKEGIEVFSAIDAERIHDDDKERRVHFALAAAREVVKMTSTNRSSMLQDVDGGRMTEIGFINGYIADMSKSLGISAPVNATLRALIEAKTTDRQGKQ